MTEHPSSDEQLLARFARGDREALGVLAQRYEMALLGLARGMLGGRRDLATDAVQETWVRVIRFARRFDRRSSVKTWLYRIAMNQCRNIQSNESARRARSGLAPQTTQIGEGSTNGRSGLDEQNQRLVEAVQSLPPAKQWVVLLCYHAGMTHEQAAEILNIPLGTLKSRLHSALETLRADLVAEVAA